MKTTKLAVAKKIIRKAAEVGLDQAGSLLLPGSWKYFKIVLMPIIKELEKKNLGTKATRASIVDTLFQRGYVDGKSIAATNLGIKTVETLEKHVPKIVDEDLTRHFEEEMEQIMQNKKKSSDVLKEAKEKITEIMSDFKKQEKEIGKELLAASIETRDELSIQWHQSAHIYHWSSMRAETLALFVSVNMKDIFPYDS